MQIYRVTLPHNFPFFFCEKQRHDKMMRKNFTTMSHLFCSVYHIESVVLTYNTCIREGTHFRQLLFRIFLSIIQIIFTPIVEDQIYSVRPSYKRAVTHVRYVEYIISQHESSFINSKLVIPTLVCIFILHLTIKCKSFLHFTVSQIKLKVVQSIYM